MYITPLSNLSPVLEISKQVTREQVSSDHQFQNLLSDLINQVKETEQVSQNDMFQLASGNADDLHTLTINSEKAELATLLLVQVRNKALDAYNEIMRVTL